MRRSRFERWLATTAIVAVATGLCLPVQAAPMTEDQISAAVPMPEPAGLPPPGLSDVSSQPALESSPAQTAAPDAAKRDENPDGTARGIAIPAAAPPVAPARVQPAVAQPESAPAATPAEAPAPTVDQRVAEKIHELFGGKIERIIDRKAKGAVEAFYAARNFAPVWIENGGQDARARAAAAWLADVSADGLDPADYPVPSFANADPGALAEAELKFTATILTYARHAQIGRVHYSRVSPDISYELVPPEAGAVLTKLAEAADVAAALDSFNPPHAGYKALKAKLAEVRNRAGEPARARIPSGQILKPGMEDDRVPALRERLGVAGDSAGTTYDKALSDAVKAFQQQHGLRMTGVLTPATVEAINGPRRDRDADVIIANMERWRWLPRDLGRAYVMVNIPDYTLRVMDRGAMVWTTKIVTGKPGEKATPLLSETMKYITVNPTWNVPPSIINNEYLPALERDPTVLDRMGLKVEHNRDGSVHIYQPPGEGNALGRIRFNFPNKFLVYQHDTPDKHLFSQAKRAFSHGCMRVQYPDRYAEVLLGISNPKDGYTVDKIHHMYGTGERDIHLNTPIPVHVTYQTAFVDDAGHLAIRDDIYGRDAKLLAALKGDDRRVADAPVERREASVSTRRQASRMPVLPAAAAPAPTSFFGGLFR
jgi:murein L,D-transpeptidase YcbB/YkuD